MKHLFQITKIALLLLSCNFYISAQSVETCLHIKVESVEECEKAEPCIPKLCDFVLGYPMIADEPKVHEAKKTVLGWMNVTMNYGFTINANMMPLFKDDDNILLFSTYMLCMARGAFVSKEYQDFEALNIFLKYIKDPKNKVVQTKAIKKFIKDWEKGTRKKYIDRGTLPKDK